MKFSKTTLSVLFSIIAVLAVFVCAKIAQADVNSDLSGYAWSSNIGWIKLNDCSDPTTPSTCGSVSYGVNIATTNPGTITGYAWAPNIGWITFNSAGCPLAGCTPGAVATWDSSGTTATIKGWARACSVYASGCSGTLAPAASLGNCNGQNDWNNQEYYDGGDTNPQCEWDGYIALDSVTAGGTGGVWGLAINASHALTGYAWGSQVIGWINSVAAQISVTTPPPIKFTDPPTGCSGSGCSPLPPNDPNDPNGYCSTNDPEFAWDAGNATSCTIAEQGGAAVPVAASSQAQGGSLATDGLYYYSVNLPVGTSSTTYTLSCTGGSVAVNLQEAVTTCPSNTTTTPPSGNPPSGGGQSSGTTKPKPIFIEQ